MVAGLTPPAGGRAVPPWGAIECDTIEIRNDREKPAHRIIKPAGMQQRERQKARGRAGLILSQKVYFLRQRKKNAKTRYFFQKPLDKNAKTRYNVLANAKTR